MLFRLKGCDKCGGDLSLNDGDWQCFQCGRYYYSAVPWTYALRREGSWGNDDRIQRRRDGFKRRPRENKSADGVASV